MTGGPSRHDEACDTLTERLEDAETKFMAFRAPVSRKLSNGATLHYKKENGVWGLWIETSGEFLAIEKASLQSRGLTAFVLDEFWYAARDAHEEQIRSLEAAAEKVNRFIIDRS